MAFVSLQEYAWKIRSFVSWMLKKLLEVAISVGYRREQLREMGQPPGQARLVIPKRHEYYAFSGPNVQIAKQPYVVPRFNMYTIWIYIMNHSLTIVDCSCIHCRARLKMQVSTKK